MMRLPLDQVHSRALDHSLDTTPGYQVKVLCGRSSDDRGEGESHIEFDTDQGPLDHDRADRPWEAIALAAPGCGPWEFHTDILGANAHERVIAGLEQNLRSSRLCISECSGQVTRTEGNPDDLTAHIDDLGRQGGLDTDDVDDLGTAGMVEYLLNPARLANPPTDHDHGIIGHRERFIPLMGDHEGGNAKLLEDAPDIAA
jgi:hypothetical protein